MSECTILFYDNKSNAWDIYKIKDFRKEGDLRKSV